MLAALAACLAMANPVPSPTGVLPTKAQLAWHRMEYTGFLHFTVNTFTDREWGHGDEPESTFNPTDFNADQIASVAKRAGMKGLILTAKHHDGFCLWPTKTTPHNVSNSPFKRDVVKLVSEACKKAGLKFGVYLSPWDRNNAHYGKPEYIGLYREQLRELLTNYGPIFEVWHDGANGGDGYYGGARETRKIDPSTYYDWPTTWALVHKLQPQAVIFSDVGPGCRWVGNEDGVAGDPCWATFTPTAPDPGKQPAPGYCRTEKSPNGSPDGKFWLPAECDVSIRPGWFWHASENQKVKTPEQLKALYFKSVGRGANLLLNIPPDRRGRIHEADERSLLGFRELLDAAFAHDLARKAAVKPKEAGKATDGKRDTYWSATRGQSLVLDFKKPVEFNTIRLREAIQMGQHIEHVVVSFWSKDRWEPLTECSTVGNCRLIQIEPVSTNRVRFQFEGKAVAVSDIGLFLDPNEAP
ncbi:MAG: alpha-L-fucosidase [Armatimonadetes bacterium]|nr:alpha-L-fucosidase [Armatimonadota bacterium]